MSEIYVGNGTIPKPTVGAGIKFTIQSSTNTSPIQIVFTSVTTINDKDTIEVEGHLINSNANGVWRVQKVTSTTFNLLGSSGNGVGGQTGYAHDYQVTPAITIPDDGDLITAASVSGPLEGSADQAPFFYRRLGKYRLVDIYDIDFGNNSTSSNYVSQSIGNTYAAVTVGAGPGLFGFAGGTVPAPPAIQAGDILETTFTFQAGASNTNDIYVGLGYSVNGSSFVRLGTPAFGVFANTKASGCLAYTTAFVAAASYFDLCIMATTPSLASSTLTLYGVGHLLVRHYRPN